MIQEISLQDEQLHLLPERAIWWPAQRAIILSDVHWGKSAHFRKHGIPMPGATQQQDAARMAAMLRNYPAEQLIIAGDLFHSKHNSEVDDFGHWRNAHRALNIRFIMGNHDILPAAFYDTIGLEVEKEGLPIGPFYIAHDDVQFEKRFTIHGHIHPGVSVRGAGTFPCFALGSHALILPAFGRFTGCKRIEPAHFKNIYIVGEHKVIKLK